MTIEDRDFYKLINAVCGLSDSMKRLEKAILAQNMDDIAYYVQDAKEKRVRSEKTLLNLSSPRS